MLSYQHGFHAGNLADVHKHALLAWMLEYMARKPKPMSYLETHSGRGLYDLSSAEASKTGEAEQGILRAESWFQGHPYMDALQSIRTTHGDASYPGSPLIASSLLRREDNFYLAELHPQEHAALNDVMADTGAIVPNTDGFEMALSRTPPSPRRGLLFCDPSFEVKSDYVTIPDFLAKIHRRWAVGVLVLWFPMLSDGRQNAMVDMLSSKFEESLLSQVNFPPARPGHGMIGSGMFIVNPPYGLAEEAKRIERLFIKNL